MEGVCEVVGGMSEGGMGDPKCIEGKSVMQHGQHMNRDTSTTVLHYLFPCYIITVQSSLSVATCRRYGNLYNLTCFIPGTDVENMYIVGRC